MTDERDKHRSESSHQGFKQLLADAESQLRGARDSRRNLEIAICKLCALKPQTLEQLSDLTDLPDWIIEDVIYDLMERIALVEDDVWDNRWNRTYYHAVPDNLAVSKTHIELLRWKAARQFDHSTADRITFMSLLPMLTTARFAGRLLLIPLQQELKDMWDAEKAH